MYSEGSGKGILAIFIACVAAVVATHWESTLFLLRFLWDLFVIHIRPITEFFLSHWPFS